MQVTDDPAGDWYGLRMDGVDWKSGVNVVTRMPTTFMVHANTPLVEVADPNGGLLHTIPRVLYYRARRVTKTGIKSAWCTPVQGIAGLTNNAMNGPNGRRVRGTDVGIPFPSLNAKVFHFDGDVLSHTGESWWALAGGIATFDTVDVAIRPVSPFSYEAGSLAGGVCLSKQLGVILHDSWWLDLWVKTSGDDDEYKLVYVGNPNNFIRILHLKAPLYWYEYNHAPYAEVGYFGPEAEYRNIKT